MPPACRSINESTWLSPRPTRTVHHHPQEPPGPERPHAMELPAAIEAIRRPKEGDHTLERQEQPHVARQGDLQAWLDHHRGPRGPRPASRDEVGTPASGHDRADV